VQSWQHEEGTVAAEPRPLVVLGATGTVGELTLDVAQRFPADLRVVALCAHRNHKRLAQLAERFAPAAVALADPEAAARFRPTGWSGECLAGPEGVRRLAAWPRPATVINAIVGAAGLEPSLAALRAGHRLGLANKESLVLGGGLLRAAAAKHGGLILPIDSEHSAIQQCLRGHASHEAQRVILTASGGPLRQVPEEELAAVTPEFALQHPTWRMGARITIDSATLFNKGLELIEAHWLFDLPFDRLGVWVHPESIVHGLVEWCDGSLLAQLSVPDMRLPIQLALSLPARWPGAVARCDLPRIGSLTFEEPDTERFPCFHLARGAGEAGGTMPAVANAADEVLVAAFLRRRIALPDIARGLEQVLAEHTSRPDPALDDILTADRWGRQRAEAFCHERDAHGASR